MGKFKDIGEPSFTLMEELSEAIQVIAKKHRFNGEWNEIPEGKEISRWDDLCGEMEDVLYQWNRLKEQVACDDVLELGDWESNDLDAPDYYDTQDVEWPTDTRSSDPEYIIASTSFAPGFEETYIFECDKDGAIWDFAEYGGLAKRWENENWKDHYAAVESVFGKDKYRYEKRIEVSKDRVVHHMFKRI